MNTVSTPKPLKREKIKRNPATCNWEYPDGSIYMTGLQYHLLDTQYWGRVASEISSQARIKYPKNKPVTYETIMNGSGAFI